MAHSPPRIGRRVPSGTAINHRESEYDSRSFDLLRRMQADHFWYRGRHRFLLHSVHRLTRRAEPATGLRVVDLGGGCGGWIAYFLERKKFPTAEVTLADSSESALRMAADFLPDSVQRCQVDLQDLPWSNRWDMVFLLDVLEHIPDHEQALHQVREAMAPGGLLFITVPALRQFWTWNDEFCQHQRRYHKDDMVRLAGGCGLRLLDARYFLFFLSPLLLASRIITSTRPAIRSEEQRRALAEKMHEVPHPIANGLLNAVFNLETPLGHLVPFPWGTSLLAVIQKPIE